MLTSVRRFMFLGACSALLSLLACTSVRPIVKGEPLSLAPDEGILLVHVDNDRYLDDVGFGGTWAISDLKPGVHLRPVVVAAGRYRWDKVRWGGRAGRLRGSDDGYWEFRVEPGRINYPGQMVIRDERSQLALHLRPRTGQALFTLRERFPELIRSYPVVFTGQGEDDLPGFVNASTGQGGHGGSP